MNRHISVMLSGALLLQMGLAAQAQTNGQNPYRPAPGNPYQGQEYQMQRRNQGVDLDFPTNQPGSQGEESFMHGAEKRYQKETQQNLNMIERDRKMIERGYDPNQTFNYGEEKKTTTPQQQSNIYYPTNQTGPETEILNNAESRLRGQYSNQQRQYQPEPFSNPYGNQLNENQSRKTIPENQKN